MHQPFKISPTQEINFLENFSLNPLKSESIPNIFTEAVFKDGKNSIKPIEEQFQVIKDLLDEELNKNQIKKDTRFKPEKFVKNLAWKELEDRMCKIFGFRNVDILHWNENYKSTTGDFQSMELNCYTYPTWRYPIDGLVTDKGFYDSTKSINTSISYSLGIIKELSAAELTAVFLHELGHNLDPALVDINYVKTNVLSKYLTDRKNKITSQEKKVIDNGGKNKLGFIGTIVVVLYGLFGLMMIIGLIVDFIEKLVFNKEKAITKIKEALSNDKDLFTRQTNQEAFADNFARMYGYGPQLVLAFSKINKNFMKKVESRYSKEKNRQKVIAEIITASLKSVHKTDMHRAHSLIKEYENDLKDPNIPSKVKEGIKEDLQELNKIVDAYVNSSDDFSNELNKMILEELRKLDIEIVEPNKNENIPKDKAALHKECFELFEEQMVDEKSKRSLTPEEKKIADERFGKISCSIFKDKHGYYATTHRAKTDFYPTLEKLPKEKVEFVSSTS